MKHINTDKPSYQGMSIIILVTNLVGFFYSDCLIAIMYFLKK